MGTCKNPVGPCCSGQDECCCAMACWIRVGAWGVFLQPAEKSPKLPATQMGIWWTILGPGNGAIPISVYINRSKSRSVHCSWKAVWQFQDGNVYPSSIQRPPPCFGKVQNLLQKPKLAICFRALVRFWGESPSSSPHAGFGLLFRLGLGVHGLDSFWKTHKLCCRCWCSPSPHRDIRIQWDQWLPSKYPENTCVVETFSARHQTEMNPSEPPTAQLQGLHHRQLPPLHLPWHQITWQCRWSLNWKRAVIRN